MGVPSNVWNEQVQEFFSNTICPQSFDFFTTAVKIQQQNGDKLNKNVLVYSRLCAELS